MSANGAITNTNPLQILILEEAMLDIRTPGHVLSPFSMSRTAAHGLGGHSVVSVQSSTEGNASICTWCSSETVQWQKAHASWVGGFCGETTFIDTSKNPIDASSVYHWHCVINEANKSMLLLASWQQCKRHMHLVWEDFMEKQSPVCPTDGEMKFTDKSKNLIAISAVSDLQRDWSLVLKQKKMLPLVIPVELQTLCCCALCKS
jgi:hypothetical protein